MRWTWGLALALALGGCARCTGRGARKNAEELLGPEATFVVSAPDLGRLADGCQALLATARGGAGGAELVAMSANLARQLGFDPLTREGLKAAGIEPDASLALEGSAVGNAGGLVAVPFANQKLLETTVRRLAKDHAGAGVEQVQPVGGQRITTLARAPGAQPLFAYAARNGYLLVGVGAGAAGRVAQALARKPADSIARAPLFASARQKVGPRELYLYLPKSGSRRLKIIPDVLAAGLSVSAKELAVRAYLALPEAHQQAVAAALVGGGAEELERLPKGAPFYLRGGVDWQALVERVADSADGKAQLAQARESAKEAGFDLDSEFYGNLAAPFALAVGLSSNVNLSTAFDFDPRRANPFRAYSLVALAQVKDGAKAAKTLGKLEGTLQKLGLTVTTEEVGGATVYTSRSGLGDGLSWTLHGHDLVLAGGLGDQLAATLQAVESNQEALAPADFAPQAKAALFGRPGLAGAVDFQQLGDTVKKLPNDAFGTGPSAFMARSMVTGVVEPLSRLKLVAAVAPTPGGITLDLSVATK